MDVHDDDLLDWLDTDEAPAVEVTAATPARDEFMAGLGEVEFVTPKVEDIPEVAVALALAKQAADVAVCDKDSFDQAANAHIIIAKGEKAAEAFKKQGRAPLKSALDEFDAGCREVIDRLAQAKARIGAVMTNWREAEKVLHATLAADANAMAAEMQAKLNETARAAGQPEAPQIEVYIGPPPRTVDTSIGTVIVTSRWTYVIEKDDDVPREYCKPDAGRLRAAVNAGVRAIPGVRIFKKDSVGDRPS